MENDVTNTYTDTNVIDDESVSNTSMDNITAGTTVGDSEGYGEMLNTLHSDLGIICSFLVLFTLVILFRYIYKFFNMFF